MKYFAFKPLYLCKSDFDPKSNDSTPISFTPKMVENKTCIELPDSPMTGGLMKEGLIALESMKDKVKSKKKNESNSDEELEE